MNRLKISTKFLLPCLRGRHTFLSVHVQTKHSAKSSSSFALGTKTQTLNSAAQLVRNALMKVSSANAEPNTFNSKHFRFYWDDKTDIDLYGLPIYAKVSGKLKI